MLVKVFSIFDQAVGAYTQPFFMQNAQMAIRAFQANVNDPKSNMFKFPEQFTLFQIGEWQDSQGTLIPQEPKSLGNGVKYKFQTKIQTVQDIIEYLESMKGKEDEA
jgi:hypothetical protein